MDVIAKDGMLVIRYATMDDYDTVLAINDNVYGGWIMCLLCTNHLLQIKIQ